MKVRILGILFTHVLTCFQRLYLGWGTFPCLLFNLGINAIFEYLYWGDLALITKQTDDPVTNLKPNAQIYILHALIYAYLNIPLLELTKMTLWSGGLVGFNHGAWYWHSHSQNFVASSLWSTMVYDVFAVHFALFGIHLGHSWLSMAATSMLAGCVTRTIIVVLAGRRFHPYVILTGGIDVPALYLLIFVAAKVTFLGTALHSSTIYCCRSL